MTDYLPSGPLNVYVFNDAVEVDERPGEKWRQVTGAIESAQVFSTGSITDGDVFIFRTTTLIPLPTGSNCTVDITQQLAERLKHGALLIYFVDREVPNLEWLPVKVKYRDWPGNEVHAHAPPHQVLESVIALIRKDAEYLIQMVVLDGPGPTVDLARSRNNVVVAAWTQFGQGAELLLPPMKSLRARVVREALSRVVPKLLPDLIRRPNPLNEPAPDWESRFAMPGAADLESDVNKKRQKLETLRSQLEAKESELTRLQGFRRLLWLAGFELEDLIRDALGEIGVKVEKRDPVDLVHDAPDGSKLYIEVEGNEGTVQLKKGQQLLGYISDGKREHLDAGGDPIAIRGAIIGNAYRRHDPKGRPPDGAQEGLFSKPLEKLALGEGWSLVTTTQLFGWLGRHLDGDKKAAGEARKALGLSE